MFSWWRSTTIAATATAPATADRGAPSASAPNGTHAAARSEPRETKRVVTTTTRNTGSATRVASGASLSSAPRPVATPLPPRKRRNTDQQLPTTAATAPTASARGAPPPTQRGTMERGRDDPFFENEHRHRHVLADRLPLRQPGGGHDDPVTGRDGAQPGDGQLAPDDHHHGPGRDLVDREQGDERGRDEQLVGDRVEQGAERGHLVAPPRQHAVEPVGERRRREDDGRDERVDSRAGNEEEDQQRDGDDPRESEPDR